MPIQLPNFLNAPLYEPDYSGVVKAIPRAFETYKQGLESSETPYELRHNRMMNAEKLKAAAFENALNEKFGEDLKKAELAEKLAHAQYYKSGGGGAGGYAPSYTAKMLNEIEDAKAGFMPGTNRTVPISPEMQKTVIDRLELGALKHTTDSAIRAQTIAATNLLKAFEKTNIEDLTRYSGPGGAARLKLEEGKDITGNPSKEYIKYKEALAAAQLEVKELRQMLKASISSEQNEELEHMINPVGISTSPKTAMAQINAVRNVLRKQVETLQQSMKSADVYKYQEKGQPDTDFSVHPYTVDDPRVLSTAKKYNITPEKVVEKLNKAQP